MTPFSVVAEKIKATFPSACFTTKRRLIDIYSFDNELGTRAQSSLVYELKAYFRRKRKTKAFYKYKYFLYYWTVNDCKRKALDGPFNQGFLAKILKKLRISFLSSSGAANWKSRRGWHQISTAIRGIRQPTIFLYKQMFKRCNLHPAFFIALSKGVSIPQKNLLKDYRYILSLFQYLSGSGATSRQYAGINNKEIYYDTILGTTPAAPDYKARCDWMPVIYKNAGQLSLELGPIRYGGGVATHLLSNFFYLYKNDMLQARRCLFSSDIKAIRWGTGYRSFNGDEVFTIRCASSASAPPEDIVKSKLFSGAPAYSQINVFDSKISDTDWRILSEMSHIYVSRGHPLLRTAQDPNFLGAFTPPANLCLYGRTHYGKLTHGINLGGFSPMQ